MFSLLFSTFPYVLLTVFSSFLSSRLFQVNPSDLSNDSNPLFMAEFFSNLKILSQNLFKATVSNLGKKNNTNTFSNINYDNKDDTDFQSDFHHENQFQNHVNFSQSLLQSPDRIPNSTSRPQSMSLSGPNTPNPRNSKRRTASKGPGSFEGAVTAGSLSAIMIPLKKRESSFSTTKDQQRDREKEREREREKEKERDYFSSESIHERLRVYAKEGGVPLDYVDRYSRHMMKKNISVAALTVQESIPEAASSLSSPNALVQEK